MGIYSGIKKINQNAKLGEASMDELRSLKNYFQGDAELESCLNDSSSIKTFTICFVGEVPEDDVCVEIYL
jgi:hypothetical protein